MAQVVQAACPGCKSLLRIPSEWLHQPIRCKNCGTVLQARAPAADPTTPVPQPTPRRATPPPPPPLPRPAAPPLAAPVAAPVAATPFDFDHPDEPVEDVPVPSARKRRRKRSGSWVGIAVAGIILILTGGGVWGVYTHVIKPRQQAAATGVDEDGAEVVGAGGKKKGGPATFPRRALIISVHNYLYANPISEGPHGTPNMQRLISSLNRALRIPQEQIVHLSDVAKPEPRPPLKSVIEEGLVNFLKTTRKQDRILVFFVGHTREIDNKAYLVPLEGETDNAASLVPLEWIYGQLAKCPARQKVLVIDGNRYNAGQGEERPVSGPMTEKVEAALKSPPDGVQVWAACSAGQQSLEFEESSLGLFLDSLRQALTPEKDEKGALAGQIQKPDDLLPIETLHSAVNERMARQTERRKVGKQVALLAGRPLQSGAEYDRSEPPASVPALPVVRAGDLSVVKAIMGEISLPPIKGGETASDDVSFELLPPFPPEVLKKYQTGDLPADSKLRQAIRDARVALWAVSTSRPPADLAAEVKALRGRLRSDTSVMLDRYGVPGGGAAENAFKTRVYEDSKAMAPIIARLENVLDNLREAGEEKDAAPPRWQANYQFILARFQAQLAYLEEYQGLLGQMRRELPPHDPNIHSGWRMASKEKASDSIGKKLERSARKIYADLAKENPQTPWEVLAKREKLTALGLEWQAY